MIKFISSDEYKRLLERIVELETEVRNLGYSTTISIIKSDRYRLSPYQDFFHKEPINNVVRKIIDHLGLQLKYQTGSGDSVTIAPIPPAPKVKK